MAGTLSIVATPIGHLEDVTLRALNVLRAVDLIAAEDTRQTGKLLAHYGIRTPTISFHEHNTRARLPSLVSRLHAGGSIALVSDAGTPLMSDPGLELVQRCIHEGIPIDSIPGPSAPLTLAVASGFPLLPWTIYGFPPIGSSHRIPWLKEVASVQHAVTFLESPHRISKTLRELSAISGNRPIIVGRELTKLHQTFYRGTAQELLTADVPARGEFTLMLGPAVATAEPARHRTDAELRVEFGEMTNIGGMNRREALKALRDRHGLSVREIYAALERSKAET